MQGCRQVIVFDGNMKSNREVCLAVDAGFAGLPGRVKTGCPNTPGFKSSLHAPLTAIPHETPTEERPGIIVDKRITRNSTLYQVCYSVCGTISYVHFIYAFLHPHAPNSHIYTYVCSVAKVQDIIGTCHTCNSAFCAAVYVPCIDRRYGLADL